MAGHDEWHVELDGTLTAEWPHICGPGGLDDVFAEVCLHTWTKPNGSRGRKNTSEARGAMRIANGITRDHNLHPRLVDACKLAAAYLDAPLQMSGAARELTLGTLRDIIAEAEKE